jgi:hypothetical protein
MRPVGKSAQNLHTRSLDEERCLTPVVADRAVSSFRARDGRRAIS